MAAIEAHSKGVAQRLVERWHPSPVVSREALAQGLRVEDWRWGREIVIHKDPGFDEASSRLVGVYPL
jgi:hypothetical protein